MFTLTDRDAMKLMELINRYAIDAAREGQSADETGDLTIRMLLNDLIGTLPSHLTVDLPAHIRTITGD